MASAIEPILKIRYAGFSNPLPSEDTIARHAKFVPQTERSGRAYNYPVYLGVPHGVTHSNSHTASTINDPIPAQWKEATLNGSEIVIADNIAYGDVTATLNGIANGGGAGGAYMDKWDECTMGLMQSGELYRELALLYGPGTTSTAAANLGVVNTVISGANLAAPQIVTITRASYAAGLWPIMNGAKVDILQSDGATSRDTAVTVSAPVESQCRITLTKAASVAVVESGDLIIARSALASSCYGLEAIAANAGTLFGISAASYPQWRVGTFGAGSAPMDRSKVLGICSRQAHRGMRGGGVLYLPSASVVDLIEEASELQRFNDTANIKKQGASSLVYTTPIGDVEVKSHPYLKQGIGLLLPNSATDREGVVRIGSTDLTFGEGQVEWKLVDLSDKMGVQMRIYSDQAILIRNPWHAVYITGIQSTFDMLPS